MCLVTVIVPVSAESPPASRVLPSDPRIQAHGVWVEEKGDLETVCLGAMIEFRLRGKAELQLQSGRPGSVRAAVMVDETRAWDGLVLEPVSIDGGEDGARIRVIYESTSGSGYDPSDYRSIRAQLRFKGLQLMEGAELFAAEGRTGPGLMFLGDSITLGEQTDRRDADRLFHTRASHSYAFRLSEWFYSPFAWFAHSGITAKGLAGRLFFHRKDQPAPLDWQPDWVLLNIGANDRRLTNEEYEQHVTVLVERITRTYPSARLVLLNFFRDGDKRYPVLQQIAKASGSRVTAFPAREHLLYYADRAGHPDWRSHASLATGLEEMIRATPWSLDERLRPAFR